MADNKFRSDRSRDPLAELARLIGQADPYQADPYQADPQQADPYAESDRHQAYGAERSGAPAADVDWTAEEGYGARDNHVGERYPERPAPAPSYPYQAPQEPGYEQEHDDEHDRHYEQDQGYEQEQAYEGDAPSGRYFSGPAAQFSGFREEPGAYEDEPPALPPARQLHQGYAAASDQHYEDDEPQRGEDAYPADDHDDEYGDEAPSPRRRTGLAVVMAVFGLAVVGTAGAFGYRAMFGGSVLPALPPIIKASNGPNRVAPAYGDAQANDASDTRQVGSAAGSAEALVSREEQPVTIEPPKSAPRVVSTIPVIASPGADQGLPQGVMPPGLSAPAVSGQAIANQAASGHVASAVDSVWPPPPQIGPPPASAPVAAPTPAPAPPPQASSGPKKIHTVTIHADQSEGADAAASPSVVRTQNRTAAKASAPPAGSNGPMSIVPGSQGGAPAPQHAHLTAAPVNVASTSAVPASGGYAVQVTSQRSESEAHTAFRALQAKYPNQLSGREPIIRRADLGEKGTYYRAMVGPFASAEEAAGLCSGLKAAGGNCIVQRN